MRRVLESGPAFITVLIVLTIAGSVVGSRVADNGVTPDELAQASVQGCEGQNEVRELTRRRVMDDVVQTVEEMVQTATTDPALFPDIEPERFAVELTEAIETDAHRLTSYAEQLPLTHPADCVERYLGDQ